VGTLAFWTYLIAMVFSTFVMTWIYNHTQRSTLSAILFHFMINFTGELFTLSPRAEILQFNVWGLVAITIALLWTKNGDCPRSMEKK
jgi:membrane protease YdiL (CAAX protease family)